MMASRLIYNKVIELADKLISQRVFLKFLEMYSKDSKAYKFVLGHSRTAMKIHTGVRRDNVLWTHVSSLGELAVVRPVIKELRTNYGKHVVLTFFSPSGYEASVPYLGTSYADADEIYYLPIDTRENASRFIDYVKPQCVIFAISEIWPNYLDELRKRKVPTYLVSAKITGNSTICKSYGSLIRDSYKCFTHIACLNNESKNILLSHGVRNVSIIGDPLFDNAIAISHKEYENEVIQRFCQGYYVFIAGSIHDKKDLEMVCFLANANPNDKFIFVPHEIHEEMLNHIKYNLDGTCLLYSECDGNTDFSDIQVLVIDFLGALSRIYRFCKYAYIGGGFTAYLHSVIEATVYGLPVAFGPSIERKVTPLQMVEMGIGKIVKNGSELDKWYKSLRKNDKALTQIKHLTERYTSQNAGATSSIIEMVLNKAYK